MHNGKPLSHFADIAYLKPCSRGCSISLKGSSASYFQNKVPDQRLCMYSYSLYFENIALLSWDRALNEASSAKNVLQYALAVIKLPVTL